MTNLPYWQQDGVIYQIYLKSFQDITGSGIGDLHGVTRHPDYLHKLGVDATWLTPFYVSPQADDGHDVANYTAIGPTHGMLDDSDELVTQARSRGIRTILDMVFNHIFAQYVWSCGMLNKESPHRQSYIWCDDEPETPSNSWRSRFGDSTWRWYAESEQHHLHLFAPEQADLNWEDSATRVELKKVCEFWVDRGVDGLRLDAMNLISKDLRLPEDLDGDGCRLYADRPRAHKFSYETNRNVPIPRELMTVGEISFTSLEYCQ